MADSASTQPTIQEQVDQKLRTQQVHAIAQTQSEITPLSKEQEPAFRAWVAAHNIRDLDVPDSHYDYRGAFLAHAEPDATGHWPDTFKQHGHPTFSVESQYSTGPQDGGTWQGDTFVPAAPTPSAPSAPVSPEHPAVEALRQLRSDPSQRVALAALGNAGPQNQAAIQALRDLHGEPGVLTAADSQAMMQQHPSFPIHFPEEPHIGPLGNVIENAATALKDVVVGSLNGVLGSASAPIPVVSDEEARRIRLTTGTLGPYGMRIGVTQVQTPHEIEQHQAAAAFVGSMLVGGATSATILRGLSKGVVKSALANTAAGGAFGALRPRYQNETLLGAIVADAALFGGLSLAGGLVGRLTKPVQLGADALKEAGIAIDPKVLVGPEYGKAIFERLQEIGDGLDAKGLVAAPDTPFGTLIDVTQASAPDNINPLRQWLGSPSHWDKSLRAWGALGAEETGGAVGEAAQRIVTNFRGRMAVALELRGEWDTILAEAHDLITKDLPPAILAGEGAGVRGALVAQRENALGRLLDNVFQPADLPTTLPPDMARAFSLIRDRLLAGREALRLFRGATADWGLNAYLPHVFVEKYAITDAADKILAFANIKDLRTTAMQLVAQHPGVPLRIVPSAMVHHAELAGIGLTGQTLARFISGAARALSVDGDEIASVLFENKVARVKPGKRFFGHALQRGETPLAGFETNPFEALRIYAAGEARSLAFHDAEQKAGAVIDALAKLPGTAPSVSALKIYVDRVLGRAGETELAFRGWVKSMVQRAAKPLGTGVQQIAEDFGDPAVALGKVATWEANIRLGYNPTSILVNLGQTATNTASAIGWGPTMRGIRLFLDKSQHAQVDALLRAMDINLAIPLTAADQITIRNIGQVSPWHPLYLFNKVETANRAIAGLAKYQEQILGGAGIREALDAARTFIKDTQFDYSTADAPRLMQGQLGGTMFQFKKFWLKEQEFIAQLPPAGKARFIATITALGGATALFSIGPGPLLDWASGELTGEKLSERAQAAAPRAARGLPGFAGVDLGGNVALGSMMQPSDVLGPGITDLFTLARDLAGKPLFDLVRGKQGHLTPADKAAAISQLVPVMARRLYDAYDVLNSGVVRSRATNQLRFEPANVDREAVLTAFGFRSLDRSEEQRVFSTNKRIEALHAKDEQAVVQAWANAYVGGDPEHASQILQDAQADGLYIHAAQLRDALAATILERTRRGVKQAPPELKLQELERLRQLERR